MQGDSDYAVWFAFTRPVSPDTHPMKLLDWLERRLSRFAIPNITLLLILGQVVVYVVSWPQMRPDGGAPLLDNIELVPNQAMAGEWWRVLTFLIFPPITNPLFAFFAWYLFYLMGTALENVWGVFRFNVFLLIGWVASVAASFLAPAEVASNAFLYGTVFLAFARFYPEFVINLFFILPIKIKWLALLMWLGYAARFVTGSWVDKVLIIAAVLNYILFFWRDHWTAAHDHRRRLKFATKSAKVKAIVHQCVVCGRSSADEPKTSFRYCSQCAGQQCYCPDHIRDHEHVAEPVANE